MADMMETLKEILGDNADEKINTVLGMLGGASEGSGDPQQSSPQRGAENALSALTGSAPSDNSAGITPELFSQAQGLMKQLSTLGGDNRSRLLMSLKPFMRESRKQSIDSAVKLLRLAQLSHMFKGVL